MNRRGFIAGLLCAPAIVRPGLLMPVHELMPWRFATDWYCPAGDMYFLRAPQGNYVIVNPGSGLKRADAVHIYKATPEVRELFDLDQRNSSHLYVNYTRSWT